MWNVFFASQSHIAVIQHALLNPTTIMSQPYADKVRELENRLQELEGDIEYYRMVIDAQHSRLDKYDSRIRDFPLAQYKGMIFFLGSQHDGMCQ